MKAILNKNTTLVIIVAILLMLFYIVIASDKGAMKLATDGISITWEK